jgi:hypothetical protein
VGLRELSPWEFTWAQKVEGAGSAGDVQGRGPRRGSWHRGEARAPNRIPLGTVLAQYPGQGIWPGALYKHSTWGWCELAPWSGPLLVQAVVPRLALISFFYKKIPPYNNAHGIHGGGIGWTMNGPAPVAPPHHLIQSLSQPLHKISIFRSGDLELGLKIKILEFFCNKNSSLLMRKITMSSPLGFLIQNFLVCFF